MRTPKSKTFELLDPHFVEIKNLILSNSTAIVVEILNTNYNLELSERDLTNYMYHQKEGFDVVNYRRSNNVFDFNRARNEDASQQHQPRFR